jgi:hypothetical protein
VKLFPSNVASLVCACGVVAMVAPLLAVSAFLAALRRLDARPPDAAMVARENPAGRFTAAQYAKWAGGAR